MGKVCRWYEVCPLKRFYEEGKLEKHWIEYYCKRHFKKCKRYKLAEEGKPHPDNMLPNGKIDKKLGKEVDWMSESRGMDLDLLKEMGYSEKAIEYIRKKVNLGKIEESSASASYQGKCGDIMMIYLDIKNGMIKNAKFRMTGCAGLAASGSALTEMIRGNSLEKAMKIGVEDIVNHLDGGLPRLKYDCAEIAINTLRKAIKRFKK